MCTLTEWHELLLKQTCFKARTRLPLAQHYGFIISKQSQNFCSVGRMSMVPHTCGGGLCRKAHSLWLWQCGLFILAPQCPPFIYTYNNDWNIKSLNVQSGGARILPCEWSIITVLRAWLCKTAGWLHALDVRSSWNMQQDMFNWTLVVMTVLPMKWRILPPGS